MHSFPQKRKSRTVQIKAMENRRAICDRHNFTQALSRRSLTALYLALALPLMTVWPGILNAQEMAGENALSEAVAGLAGSAATSTESFGIVDPNAADLINTDAPAGETATTTLEAPDETAPRDIFETGIDLPLETPSATGTIEAASTTDQSVPEIEETASTTESMVSNATETEIEIEDIEIVEGADVTENIIIETEDTASLAEEAALETPNATSTEESAATTTEETAEVNMSVEAPRILAQWQMTEDGSDDDPAAPRAQFNPSGEYQVSKRIKICAAVSGQSLEGIKGVYGQIYYPDGAAFGPTDPQGRKGCGEAQGAVLPMERMDTAAGFDLFCEKIQKYNTGLPVFGAGVTYQDLCAADGRLLNGFAKVYCAPSALAYDDVSGIYRALVMAQLDAGYSEGLESQFEYVASAKIEIDFGGLDYGTVIENIESTVDGDAIWAQESLTRATARNVGNVRAAITVWQDDMGVGESGDGIYNIRYKARMGAGNPWEEYGPFATTTLANFLDLGSDQPLDFSVIVRKFVDDGGVIKYSGKMSVDALPAPHYRCEAPPVHAEPVMPDPVIENSEGAPEESIAAKPENGFAEAATTTSETAN